MTTQNYENFLAEHDARTCCLKVLEQMLHGLDSGEVKLRIPRQRGLFRRIEHSPFHPINEIFLQIGGVTRFFLPEENLSVYADEICIIPRGMPHCERAEKYRSSFLNLLFMIRKDCIYYHFAIEGKNHNPKGIMDKIGRCRPSVRVDEYCEAMLKASESDSKTADLVIKGLGLAFLGTLHSVVSRRNEPALSSESAKIRQCRDIVNMQLSQPDLNVRTIAGLMRCSADYLSHLFRKETGLSLVDYINKLRVEQARDLLLDDSLNISEIAWSCGYSDPGYFTRVFRKFTGFSPRRYRLDLEH